MNSQQNRREFWAIVAQRQLEKKSIMCGDKLKWSKRLWEGRVVECGCGTAAGSGAGRRGDPNSCLSLHYLLTQRWWSSRIFLPLFFVHSFLERDTCVCNVYRDLYKRESRETLMAGKGNVAVVVAAMLALRVWFTTVCWLINIHNYVHICIYRLLASESHQRRTYFQFLFIIWPRKVR